MAFQSVFIIIVGAFGIISNGLTLFVFFCDPLRVFKHSSTYFIKSLTVADLLTSIVAIVWGVDIFPSNDFRDFCKWVFWTTIQASIYTLVSISGERYIAVVYPQKRRRLLTGTRITICIIITWVLSALSSVLLAVSKYDLVHFVLYLFILLAIWVFSLLYVIMFWQMRRGCRRLEAQLEVENEQKHHVSQKKTRRNKLQRTHSVEYRRLTIERERRLLSLVLMLIIILWSTVVPYLTTTLIFFGKRLFCHECNMMTEYRAMAFIFPIELLNFAVNPILYAFRLSHYRQSIVSLVSRCFRIKTVLTRRVLSMSDHRTSEIENTRHRQEPLCLDKKTATDEKKVELSGGSMSLLPLGSVEI